MIYVMLAEMRVSIYVTFVTPLEGSQVSATDDMHCGRQVRRPADSIILCQIRRLNKSGKTLGRPTPHQLDVARGGCVLGVALKNVLKLFEGLIQFLLLVEGYSQVHPRLN